MRLTPTDLDQSGRHGRGPGQLERLDTDPTGSIRRSPSPPLTQCEAESNWLTRLLTPSGPLPAGGAPAGYAVGHPVPGFGVESPFGLRLHPILGRLCMHYGADFAVDYGHPIRAAAAGTVVMVESLPGYGNLTVVDHGDGFSTVYAHQERVGVEKGQTVAAYANIGRVGSSGMSTGPHLHFEVRLGGIATDPWPMVERGQ